MNTNCKHCRNAGAKSDILQRMEREDLIAVLPDTAEMRDAFRVAVCAYADFSRYQEKLVDLLESYDESHEDYNPDSWLDLTVGSGCVDSLIMAGYEAIEAAEEILTCILNRMERACGKMLRTVLSASAKQQRRILGRSFSLSKTDIDIFVDTFFESAYELDFNSDADANYDVFIAAVLYELGEFYS